MIKVSTKGPEASEAPVNRKKKMKRILCLFLALILVFVITGCKNEQTSTTGSGKSSENKGGDGEMKYPFEILDKNAQITATIEMEDGDKIELEFYPDVAPITVSNFVYLAEKGFYDGLIFHRVIPGFMIQGGCPDGNGFGGPGYSIKGEFSANGVENKITHERGVISMARSTAFDSAGSQFFIMHGNADYLDGQYAAFGRVTEGIEVVDKIAAVQTDNNDKPLKNVVIKKITIKR